MIKRHFKRLLYRYILPYGGLLLVRVLSWTYRLKIVDGENEKNILDTRGSLIYASWHQRFFPGITFFSTRKPISIMISRSNDGSLISKVVDILGWHPVRGSSSRGDSSKGGKEALEEIKTLALSNYKVGHIVDGPQGPFGEIKPGLLRIAQVADLLIVPTITSGQNRWVFNKSWDKFMIPKPFSRVMIRFGKPIEVPADISPEEFEEKRLYIKNQMKLLYEDTDNIWSDPDRIKTIFS